MMLDLGSLAFGSIIEKGGGTPSWGTSLGQAQPEYKLTRDGFEEILVGMFYNSVNLHHVSLPLGKGGHVDIASNFDECHLASIFRKVYINEIPIGYPFIMIIIKEQSKSHTGRRTLKYSDKFAYNFSGGRFSNQEFFRIARKELGLIWESCWFIHEVNVRNQDELHFKAVIVNKECSESYRNTTERGNHWRSLIK